MALLQPRLNLKVAQKQVLTPGLVQMVSLLALNKQELKEMIDAEILENPVLEELEESVPLIDEVRTPEEAAPPAEDKKEDPFDEIDFGSYFQDYLDPGYRTPESSEISERPSFENFLSKSTTLTDHLMWQLGSVHLEEPVRQAAELVIGNLNEDGYLTASDDELLATLMQDPSGAGVAQMPACLDPVSHASQNGHEVLAIAASADEAPSSDAAKSAEAALQAPPALRRALQEALDLVRGFDPAGIGARDLRECLLMQLDVRAAELARIAAAPGPVLQPTAEEIGDGAVSGEAILMLARRIIDEFLNHLLKRDLRELTRLTASKQPTVQAAIDLIRTLDPKPGQRYNREQPRLIEPDVAFVKRDDQFVILINDEEIPTLRLNHGYRRMLSQEGTEREVRDYVKERYRSAIQLMRNIEQRKNTILRTCEVIVRRQRDFLEQGVDALRPMMIKEVAEEIGVHASTVSRAVANKYAHTPQGVFELRFFFSEGVNGPEGADTPLLLLKRKVKKMIEEEDSSKPLTDDAIAALLQAQGIAVNRRTVAKYREDLGIPSTHQRRVRI
jgi:RNA polymerase sigma-54 factor